MSFVRLSGAVVRPPEVVFTVDGERITAPDGECLAVALACAARLRLRGSPRDGAPRGAFCFMGACQECAVRVDGEMQLACQVAVRDGLEVSLSGSL